jgi:prolyl-tRNA editing enzyme YbaK/EbsC (Cys-tRNA(Pro) deacylase)
MTDDQAGEAVETGSDGLDDADRLVREHLAALGTTHELLACDPALADTAAFCQAYGIDAADSANTIIVVGKTDPVVHVACVVLATTRLDVNRAVRGRLGVRRCSFASGAETRELTNMEIGGVTAFGLPPGLPVWIDAAVLTRERVVLGGGSRRWKVSCAPGELTRIAGALVVEGLAGPVVPA